jgi:hypothetical protein
LESGEDKGWIFSERVRDLRAKAWMWWTWGEAVRVLRMLEPCLVARVLVRMCWVVAYYNWEFNELGDCLRLGQLNRPAQWTPYWKYAVDLQLMFGSLGDVF